MRRRSPSTARFVSGSTSRRDRLQGRQPRRAARSRGALRAGPPSGASVQVKRVRLSCGASTPGRGPRWTSSTGAPRVADERAAGGADAVAPPARRDARRRRGRRPRPPRRAVLAAVGEARLDVDVDDALDGERRVGEQAARVATPAARSRRACRRAAARAGRGGERRAELERGPVVLAAAERDVDAVARRRAAPPESTATSAGERSSSSASAGGSCGPSRPGGASTSTRSASFARREPDEVGRRVVARERRRPRRASSGERAAGDGRAASSTLAARPQTRRDERAAGPRERHGQLGERRSARRARRRREHRAHGPGRRPRASSSAGSCVEDRALERLERRRRLDPEALDERLPRRAVGLERLGLPARAVEREHQLAAEPLAQRVLGDERLELGDERGVPAEREVCVDPLLERREAQLLEPLDAARANDSYARSASGGRARGRAPRGAAPPPRRASPRERLRSASSASALEARRGRAARRRREQVAGRPRLDRVGRRRARAAAPRSAAAPASPRRRAAAPA